MATVTDYEHQALAHLIEGAAALVHDDCDLCAGLDLRRHLYGLAEQIKAAVERRVNGTPHTHGPKPTDPPKPNDPPPTEDTPPPPPEDRADPSAAGSA